MLEDRLRDAFTALADTADSPPPGLRHPASRAPAIAAAAAVLVIGGGAWFAFQPEPVQITPAPAQTTAPTTTQPQPPVLHFQLYTHCGVDEALIGRTFYEAETPIPGPPSDWGNPYQAGTMTLTSPTEAVFQDDLGHKVKFRARPGATAFKRICK
ncbi:hypothetical protein JOF56_000676 [Kibdelosporangium banguiense]|uniref:Uncharacterized protein n=1 Tax=Kibdelosporangium banguiense TaxID=1365924 RepID=A0ABS4T8W8_9PSEU|nr:hypothetical protein [Kibdelosporangium banguiense]MBP2320291.1 hypothetical protein [Kibdelosporangium banguiense]